MNPDDILTLEEIEAQYAITRRQLQRACKTKELVTIKPLRDMRKRAKAGKQAASNAGAPIKYRVVRRVLEDWLNSRLPPDGYLTVEQAAEQCNVNARELYEAIGSKEVPAHIKPRRIGRNHRIYVLKADVEQWRDHKGIRRYKRLTTH